MLDAYIINIFAPKNCLGVYIKKKGEKKKGGKKPHRWSSQIVKEKKGESVIALNPRI